MKEIIQEFKQKNGNNSFTNKEILMYVASKIDKIEEKIDNVRVKVAGIKTSQKYLWGIMSVIIGIMIYLLKVV